MKRMSRKHLATPYVFWIICFTILPLIYIAWYAISDRDGGYTFENILAIFEPVHWKAFVLSIELALICTVICLLLAYPVVLILRRLRIKKKGTIVAVLILPMWMNFILRVYAWQVLLSDNGIINSFLGMLGLPSINIINTPAAIVFGMVYDFLPFMILPIYNSLMEIPNDIIEAAKDLGADGFTIFRKIIWKLTLPGVISGITMVFVPAMTSFVFSDILGGGKIQLIGNVIEQEFTTSMNWQLGSGLSIALMTIILLIMALLQKSNQQTKGNNMIW